MGCVCFSMIIGSVCLRRERAAPASLISMSSITTCGGNEGTHVTPGDARLEVEPRDAAHLLVEVNERVVGQLEGLDGQKDGVPVATVNVRYEAVDALHCVERDGGFLLQGCQRSIQVVLLEVLHDEADHTTGTRRGAG